MAEDAFGAWRRDAVEEAVADFIAWSRVSMIMHGSLQAQPWSACCVPTGSLQPKEVTCKTVVVALANDKNYTLANDDLILR